MTLRQKHFIDSHKCATAPVVLGMMALHGAWQNETAWIYLALHGTYGLLWTLKSFTFGDRQWEQPTSIGYGLVIWGGLSLYWIAPFLITRYDVRAPSWYLGLAVALYTFGIFLHFASDMQKHMSLLLRPGTLIDDGLWARTRNPNYLGELLIYGGFTMLAMHWLPLLALALMVAAVWVPNMARKDRSLSRYPTFAAYKRRSGVFFPFFP